MIKLIALDLDGTLLTPEKEISERNKAAINRARAAGVKIVLCTGRPLGGIRRYVEELELNGEEDYSITYNGGLVQKNSTGEVLSQKVLSYEQILDLYDLSQKVNLPMNMLDLECVYEPECPPGRPSLYRSLMSASLPFIRKDIASFDPGHVFNKVVYCIQPELLDAAIAEIPQVYFEKYSMMKSRPMLFELMHPEVNKGKGIQALCEVIGLDSTEVMACGDEENDVAMLTYAGIGVAMGNASETIRAYADFVTLTNTEHGVAHAIEEFVLNG